MAGRIDKRGGASDAHALPQVECTVQQTAAGSKPGASQQGLGNTNGKLAVFQKRRFRAAQATAALACKQGATLPPQAVAVSVAGRNSALAWWAGGPSLCHSIHDSTHMAHTLPPSAPASSLLVLRPVPALAPGLNPRVSAIGVAAEASLNR